MNSLRKEIKGEYVCYLNSGDKLIDKYVLMNIHDAINTQEDKKLYPLVWCSAKFISHCSKVEFIIKYIFKKNLNFLKNWIKFEFYICHQACFIRSDYMKNYQYQINNFEVDYLLKDKLLKNKSGSLYVPIIACEYFLDGLSSNINNKVYFKHLTQLKKYKFFIRIFIFLKLTFKFFIEIVLKDKRHYYKLIKYKFLIFFTRIISYFYFQSTYKIKIIFPKKFHK